MAALKAVVLAGRVCGVELPVALFEAASPLVPGNRDANMVRASPVACSGDLLLRLAGCQGEGPIAEVRRAALATSGFALAVRERRDRAEAVASVAVVALAASVLLVRLPSP